MLGQLKVCSVYTPCMRDTIRTHFREYFQPENSPAHPNQAVRSVRSRYVFRERPSHFESLQQDRRDNTPSGVNIPARRTTSRPDRTVDNGPYYSHFLLFAG